MFRVRSSTLHTQRNGKNLTKYTPVNTNIPTSKTRCYVHIKSDSGTEIEYCVRIRKIWSIRHKQSQLFSYYQQKHRFGPKINILRSCLSLPSRPTGGRCCQHMDPDNRDRERLRKLISDPSVTLLMVREEPVKISSTIIPWSWGETFHWSAILYIQRLLFSLIFKKGDLYETAASCKVSPSCTVFLPHSLSQPMNHKANSFRFLSQNIPRFLSGKLPRNIKHTNKEV